MQPMHAHRSTYKGVPRALQLDMSEVLPAAALVLARLPAAIPSSNSSCRSSCWFAVWSLNTTSPRRPVTDLGARSAACRRLRTVESALDTVPVAECTRTGNRATASAAPTKLCMEVQHTLDEFQDDCAFVAALQSGQPAVSLHWTNCPAEIARVQLLFAAQQQAVGESAF